MKKNIISFLFFHILFGFLIGLYGQELLNFTPYYITGEKIYYLDTLSIKVEPDAITLDHMIYFKEPFILEGIKSPVSLQKSNLTIDPVSIKYKSNRVRYYDIKDKLILDLDKEELDQEENKAAGEPLFSDLMYERLLGKVRDYLILGRLIPDIESGTVENALSVLLKDTLKITDGYVTETKDSIYLYGEAVLIEESLDEEMVTADNDNLAHNNVEDVESAPEDVSNYQVEKETNVENMIFSDGRLFCFQVSSWKTEKKAVRLAQELVQERSQCLCSKNLFT